MTEPDAPIRLAIDDHPMVRAALGMLLGGDSGTTVVGAATNDERATTLAPGPRPRCRGLGPGRRRT